MDKDMLTKAYEAIEILQGLNLPVSEEQIRGLAQLENTYLNENVVPHLKKEMEPFFSSLRNRHQLEVSFVKGEGVKVAFPTENVVRAYVPSREVTRTQSLRNSERLYFSIEGGRPLTKRRLVLAIVRKYVKDHPHVTLEELDRRFPPTLSNSQTYRVVKPYNEIIARCKSQPDLKKRFFLNPEEIITLEDGTKVVVFNQWGKRFFPRFLALAQQLYQVKIVDD